LERLMNNGQLSSPGSVTQITKVSDSHEAFRQDVHQESTNKLHPIQFLGLLATSLPVIFVPKHDPVTLL
jgi:hypothetical protein